MADERQQGVLEAIGEICDRDPESLSPDLHLAADLGIDSADGLMILIEIEDRLQLEISDEEASLLETVGDVLDFIDKNPKG